MFRHSKFTKYIYIASFCFGLQGALAAYINSTYLAKFIPEIWIGLIYSVGAFCALCMLALAPRIIRNIGNRQYALLFLVVNLFALFFIGQGSGPILIIGAFIAYLATNSAIMYAFDLFIEHVNPIPSETGRMRGIYLTVLNVAWMFAPLISGYILAHYGFTMLYGLSMVFVLCTFLFLGSKLRGYKNPIYKTISFRRGISALLANKNLRNIASVNFILQLFYSWMIVFLPVYLVKHLGFSWEDVGIMFTIMLAAFVILQYPLGKLADTNLGEKELLISGLCVMGLSCLLVPFFAGATLFAWAGLLFLSRVGAATIESMAEIYFFKQIGERDTGLLSTYRLTSPMAFIIGPLLGSAILFFSSYGVLFFILGIVVLSGLYYAIKLKDTR